MLTRDAALAVIVTRTLPAGLAEFGEVEGVWVTTRAHATGLATVFRAMLIQVARTRHIASLQNGHGRALADYMAGPAFRTKMEAALRLLARRQAALEREKARHQREWAGAAQETEQIIQLLLEIGAEAEERVAGGLPSRNIAEK